MNGHAFCRLALKRQVLRGCGKLFLKTEQPVCSQVGKKKTQDVQFYTEVMEVNQAIDAGRRSMYDPDELEEEQRERETRNRVRTCPWLVAQQKLPQALCSSCILARQQ